MNETQPLLMLLDAVPAHQLRNIAAGTILGVQQIGEKITTRVEGAPVQTIAAAILQHDTDPLSDVWITNAACQRGHFDDVQICHNDDVLFGVLEIDAALSAGGDDVSALRIATDAAYRQIFATLQATNFPHLWRTWNYIPDIHGAEAGLERYQQFNIGRHQAFESARLAVDASPAASALGTRDGSLSIAFIAGRVAPQRIENPRQVSAYHYPAQYGPRSPAFSRAAAIGAAQHRLLFVSGTASIVGHETLHAGDIAAQTRESITNISALLEQVNASSAPALLLSDLSYRVYIRHRQHSEIVRHTLDALLGANPSVLYVQADICREDLLVEIEAFAVTPITATP